MSENVLYILMRNDLPSLGPGRAAAQSSHASNAFWRKFGCAKSVEEWADSTHQGFGTAIVLSATIYQIDNLIKKAGQQGIFSGQIVDPDYAITISYELVPFLDKNLKDIKVEQSEKDPTKYIIHRQEITCGYIFGDKESLEPLLGDLPLYS